MTYSLKLRTTILVTLLTVVSVILAPVASAQSGASPQGTIPLIAGTRVRVRSINMVAPVIAQFMEVKGDTAFFIEDNAGRGVWSIQLSEIAKLERSDGEHRRQQPYIRRGVLWGAGIGFGAAYLYTSAAKPSNSGKKFQRLPSAAIGGLVGAGVGAYIGSRFRDERWVNVPVIRGLSIAPNERGLQVGWSFSF